MGIKPRTVDLHVQCGLCIAATPFRACPLRYGIRKRTAQTRAGAGASA